MKKSVYNNLKKKIITGELLPGDFLVEREIADEYNISRTPVREVLRKLTSNGLIQQEDSKGYIIRKFSLEEIFSIFQTREAIEGMASRLACQKGDANFFLKIKQIGEKIKEADIEINPQDAIFHGRELHDLIIATANNSFLLEFYEKLKDLSALIRNISKNSIFVERKSQEAHLVIINAFLEKDEKKSEYSMREHLRMACKLAIQNFYPSLFSESDIKRSPI